MTTVNGPIFAAAVDQILTATAQHRDHPVLGGVNLEVEADTVTLTATDRFRLSTRSVSAASQPSPEHTGAPGWHAVVDGDDLRSVLETIRRHHRVHLAADGSGLTIGFHDLDDDLDDDDLVGNHSDDGDVALRCRVLPERFPDYRGMLDGLPPVVTRVVAPRGALVRAIEDRQHEFLVLNMREGIVMVGGTSDPAAVEIAATVDGPAVRMAFAMTTLYPALVSAVGAEVMIDISAPHMPVVIRSADNGDLTTLAMPIDREHTDGMSEYDLQRFIDAQDRVWSTVRAELKAGRKQTHWMWFIFPQLAGLGLSPTAQHYAINDLTEAKLYLSHEVLGPRFQQAAKWVNTIEGRTVGEIFGHPDDLKLHSSMTLFAEADPQSASDPQGSVFAAVLSKYFGGRLDERTLELLGD